MGLGIHGEPGAMVAPLPSADKVVDDLLAAIVSPAEGCGYMSLRKGDRVALLVNNLGGTTAIELAITARRAIMALRQPPYEVEVLAGAAPTSAPPSPLLSNFFVHADGLQCAPSALSHRCVASTVAAS